MWCDVVHCSSVSSCSSRKYYPFKAIQRNMKMKWKRRKKCLYVNMCPTTCETLPSRKVDDDAMLFIIIRRNSNDKVRYIFSQKKKKKTSTCIHPIHFPSRRRKNTRKWVEKQNKSTEAHTNNNNNTKNRGMPTKRKYISCFFCKKSKPEPNT